MALPLIVSFTLRFMFQLVDLVFARLIDETNNDAIAAIGLYSVVQFVFIAVWVGFSGGFTASLSQAFGSRDEARVASLKRTMLKLLCTLIPSMSMIGVALWFVIPHLGLQQGLADAFATYGTTLAIGMPLVGFWSMYPDSIVKAHQATRDTMVAGLLASVCNVALNSLFALVLGWGLFGIALATILSRFASLAYALWRAAALERARLRETWEPLPRTWSPPLGSILRLAVPGGLTFLLAALESGVINGLLLRAKEATTAVATYAVYDRLLLFAMMPASATAMAVVPFVARLLPSGEVRRIRHDLWRAWLMATGASLLITFLAGWVFADPITRFWIRGREDVDVEHVVSLAREAVHLLPLGALALVPFFVLRPTFEAANHLRLGVLVSMLRYLAFSIPLAWLAVRLAPTLGLSTVTAVVFGLVIAGVLSSTVTVLLVGRTLVEGARRDAST
ncbi:MAG: hypothetical protein CMJ85_00925 [Planctomycetes bacterium]|jgi:Na+-driven multidrug efflux pump|nr:hypothetical protein [Planctomycetota bacterium]